MHIEHVASYGLHFPLDIFCFRELPLKLPRQNRCTHSSLNIDCARAWGGGRRVGAVFVFWSQSKINVYNKNMSIIRICLRPDTRIPFFGGCIVLMFQGMGVACTSPLRVRHWALCFEFVMFSDNTWIGSRPKRHSETYGGGGYSFWEFRTFFNQICGSNKYVTWGFMGPWSPVFFGSGMWKNPKSMQEIRGSVE